MVIDVKLLLEVLVLIITVVSGTTIAISGLKRWIKYQVADPVKETKNQIQPNGGLQETTRHLIESTSKGVDDINTKLSDVTLITEKHSILIQELANRLDRHLLVDHHTQGDISHETSRD